MTLVRGEHPDAEHETPAPLVLRERNEPHLIEVLSDRIDQLAFSLDRDTGIDGELLTAVGELGGQIETLGTVTSQEIVQVASQIESIHQKISEGLETSQSFQLFRDSLAEESRRLSDLIVASAQRPDPSLDIAPIRQALARFLTRILAALKRRAETQDNAQTELQKGVEAISKRLDEGFADEAALQKMIAPILGPAMDDLQAGQAKMTETLSTLERRRPKQPDLKPLQSSVNDCFSQIDNLSKRIESFEQGIIGRFERLESLLTSASENSPQAEPMETRISEVVQACLSKGPEPHLDRISERLSELGAANERVIKSLNAQDGESNVSPAILIEVEDRLSHQISKASSGTVLPPDFTHLVEQVEASFSSYSSRQDERDKALQSQIETVLISKQASEAKIASMLTELRNDLLERQELSSALNGSKEIVASHGCAPRSVDLPEIPVHQSVSRVIDQLAAHFSAQGSEDNQKHEVLVRDLRFAMAEALANAERQLQSK